MQSAQRAAMRIDLRFLGATAAATARFDPALRAERLGVDRLDADRLDADACAVRCRFDLAEATRVVPALRCGKNTVMVVPGLKRAEAAVEFQPATCAGLSR